MAMLDTLARMTLSTLCLSTFSLSSCRSGASEASPSLASIDERSSLLSSCV